MQSLRDIQYAFNGDPKRDEYEYKPKPSFMAKEKKASGMIMFKLIKNNRSGGVYIPNIDYAIDERTITPEKPYGNGPEMIRLLRGVNTIWAKEQTGLDAKFIQKNARWIEFPAGTRFRAVPAHDVTMVEFMRLCKHNTRNPKRIAGSKTEFFEYDPTEVAKERLQKEQKEMLAIVTSNQVPFEKMKKHAFFLGIPLANELGLPKDEGQLRPDYMLAAKREPVRYIDTLDSPEVEITFNIRMAIIDNKITISGKDGRIYWSDGGGLICSCPKPDKAVDVLVELGLSKNEEGRDFLEKLKRVIT
jgi:hypothetical protein